MMLINFMELIRMVKKNMAPERIKLFDLIFNLTENKDDYICYDNGISLADVLDKCPTLLMFNERNIEML